MTLEERVGQMSDAERCDVDTWAFSCLTWPKSLSEFKPHNWERMNGEEQLNCLMKSFRFMQGPAKI